MNRNPTGQSDFGAGTRTKFLKRTVAGFAKNAVIHPASGRVLFNLSGYFKPQQIIELGTGLGIGTMYLALGNPSAKVITIEGNPVLAAIAEENFRKAGLENICIVTGRFDDVLPGIIKNCAGNLMVFIDGNHTFEATLRYCGMFTSIIGFKGVIIIDDINWSAGMMSAWETICSFYEKAVHVNLFNMGILIITD